MPRQIVIVDSREPWIVKQAIQAQLDDAPEFVQLPEADFMIPDKDNHLLGVERKTVSDFISSLKDGRIREQFTRMKSTYSLQGLIVEGSYEIDGRGCMSFDGYHTRWSHGSYQMALWSLQRFLPDLVVWWTNGLGETADLIRVIANRGSRGCFADSSLFGEPVVRDHPMDRVPGGRPRSPVGTDVRRTVKAPVSGKGSRVS